MDFFSELTALGVDGGEKIEDAEMGEENEDACDAVPVDVGC